MRCYFQILIISTVITVQWIGEVRCKPHKHIRKNIHVDRPKVPIKHVSLFLEKITPFGKLEFKHVINKRQAELPDILPKDVPIIEGTIDALTETKELPVESHSDPVVIITSVVNPEDGGKSLLLSLPSDSKLLVTPEYKSSAIIEKSVNEVLISKTESKQEVIESSVIEIDSPVEGLTPKPVEPLPPPEVPVEPTVVIDAIETPVQDGLPPPPPPPPIVTIPIYRTLNFPYVSSIGNEGKKFLYTDITKIPLSFASYPTPVAVPVPEIILPQPQQPLPPPPPPPLLPPPPPPLLPAPPPPVIKEELPPIKEENPNFFVKGSRLVLFVGSMMLQMLSKFVNGGFNINQIPIPIIPEV